MIVRTAWDQLPAEIRSAIAARTGPVISARDASAGMNSAIAVIIHAAQGTVFVKGLPKNHPGVVTQSREAIVNPYIRSVGPTLLWHTEIDSWDLLGFDHLDGRHADFRPGSPDIAKLVTTMRSLAAVPCPDLPQLKRAEKRWATFIDNPADLALLAGRTLLHTDYNPDNVLIDGTSARLVDWAWPTLGAVFIDPACLVVRLVAAGHTPADAEAQVCELPGWDQPAQHGITVFAAALERMWSDISTADQSSGWKAQTTTAARIWSRHRQTTAPLPVATAS